MRVLLGDLPEHVQFVNKLQQVGELPRAEADAILAVPVTVREYARGDDLVRDHDRPTQCVLLLDGFTCRYKMLSDGKRQISAFHIAGDMPDLQSLLLHTMDHSIGAVAPTRVAAISHEVLRPLIFRNPSLCHALWRDTLVDSAIHREWMMGIGRLSAHARIGHMLCELLLKHRAAGLTRDNSFMLPLTQAEIADALGLTPVHVNRVLQDLRSDGLIRLSRKGEATIDDWERLKRLAEFDPTYLHMESREVA